MVGVGDPVGEGDRFTFPSSGESIPAGHALYPLVDRLGGPSENSDAGPAGLAFSAVPGSCIASGGREPAEADRERRRASESRRSEQKLLKPPTWSSSEKYFGF